MTKTIFAIVLLGVFGLAAGFLSSIVPNIAGIPGALLAGMPGNRSEGRFRLGVTVAAMGQSYVYLAYTAFIVSWTRAGAGREDFALGFLLWPVAFGAVFVPMWRALIHARIEARELDFANPQVEALHYTLVSAVVGFFLFAFVPSVARAAWGWVPYVR